MSHIRGKFVLCLAIVAVVTLAAGGLVTAAPPDSVTKGPPPMDKIVSIHCPRRFDAKGGVPGAPDKPAKPDGETKDFFKYSGIRWAVPEVEYQVNLGGRDVTFLGGIDAAFAAWEEACEVLNFERASGDGEAIPSSFVGAGSQDDKNDIGWVDLSSRYPGAIAVTATLYDRFTREIGEVDLAFNASDPWAQADIGDADPDDATGALNCYDVQNIATHEVGHWLLLGDFYSRPANPQSMYGYGFLGELQKRSLESGDIAGVLTIYPPSTP